MMYHKQLNVIGSCFVDYFMSLAQTVNIVLKEFSSDKNGYI